MPYLRQNTDGLVKLIRAYNYNGKTLADVIQTSHQTALNKLKNPETFTVKELRLLARKGHIPIDEVRGAL